MLVLKISSLTSPNKEEATLSVFLLFRHSKYQLKTGRRKVASYLPSAKLKMFPYMGECVRSLASKWQGGESALGWTSRQCSNTSPDPWLVKSVEEHTVTQTIDLLNEWPPNQMVISTDSLWSTALHQFATKSCPLYYDWQTYHNIFILQQDVSWIGIYIYIYLLTTYDTVYGN